MAAARITPWTLGCRRPGESARRARESVLEGAGGNPRAREVALLRMIAKPAHNEACNLFSRQTIRGAKNHSPRNQHVYRSNKITVAEGGEARAGLAIFKDDISIICFFSMRPSHQCETKQSGKHELIIVSPII